MIKIDFKVKKDWIGRILLKFTLTLNIQEFTFPAKLLKGVSDFRISTKPVSNACNFARDAGGFPKGEQALFPFWSGVG